MHKTFLATGAALAGLAVILGAFGAHKLKEMVPPETVTTFQTGVQYQFYHAFAILITAMLFMAFPASPQLKWAAYCFIAGIILFSGSLYALTLLKATDTVGLSKLGIVTPFGGLFFIAGWVMVLLAVLKK